MVIYHDAMVYNIHVLKHPGTASKNRSKGHVILLVNGILKKWIENNKLFEKRK